MSKVRDIEQGYWKFFNKLAKFLGWWFLVLGGIGFAVATFGFFGELTSDQIQESQIGYRVMELVWVATFPLAGLAFILIKPYYPKHLRNCDENDT